MQTNCRDILSLGILSAVLLTGAGIIKAERGFAQTGASSSHRAVEMPVHGAGRAPANGAACEHAAPAAASWTIPAGRATV